MEKGGALRGDIHGKTDAEGRGQRAGAITLKGEQEYEQRREDAPGRKAASKLRRRDRHENAERHKECCAGMLGAAAGILERQRRAVGCERREQQRDETVGGILRAGAEDVNELHREHQPRRHQRRDMRFAVPACLPKGVGGGKDQHARGNGAQGVGKIQKQQRAKGRAEQRADAFPAAAGRCQQPQRKRRVAAADPRAGKDRRKQKPRGAAKRRLRPVPILGKREFHGLSTSHTHFFTIVPGGAEKSGREMGAPGFRGLRRAG